MSRTFLLKVARGLSLIVVGASLAMLLLLWVFLQRLSEQCTPTCQGTVRASPFLILFLALPAFGVALFAFARAAVKSDRKWWAPYPAIVGALAAASAGSTLGEAVSPMSVVVLAVALAAGAAGLITVLCLLVPE
jgi:hypothetical protein